MVKETTMKKLFIVISILSSIMLLASCEEAQSHGTLRINLASDSSRSILPEDFPLNIVSYRITGSGPAGASLDIETSKTSTTVDGMAVGEWELQATALNENGDALVRGSTEVRITGRSANTTIYLDELIGKGDVTILSPGLHIFVTDRKTADCPEAVDTAATPPSRAAILFSNTSLVVFVIRV